MLGIIIGAIALTWGFGITAGYFIYKRFRKLHSPIYMAITTEGYGTTD